MDNSALKFAVIAGIAYLVYRSMRTERYEDSEQIQDGAAYETVVEPTRVVRPAIKRSPLLTAEPPLQVGQSVNLLPKPSPDTDFSQFAPNPKDLAGQNFVDASRWVSLGSMSSRRNINRDLRADIPIPKNNAVSPWNQSTIEQQQPTTKPLDCPM